MVLSDRQSTSRLDWIVGLKNIGKLETREPSDERPPTWRDSGT